MHTDMEKTPIDTGWAPLLPRCVVEIVPGDPETGIPSLARVTHESYPLAGTMFLVSASGLALDPYRLTYPPTVGAAYYLRYSGPTGIYPTSTSLKRSIVDLDGVDAWFASARDAEIVATTLWIGPEI